MQPSKSAWDKQPMKNQSIAENFQWILFSQDFSCDFSQNLSFDELVYLRNLYEHAHNIIFSRSTPLDHFSVTTKSVFQVDDVKKRRICLSKFDRNIMHACMYICMCKCMFVCTGICICVRICTYVYLQIYIFCQVILSSPVQNCIG